MGDEVTVTTIKHIQTKLDAVHTEFQQKRCNGTRIYIGTVSGRNLPYMFIQLLHVANSQRYTQIHNALLIYMTKYIHKYTLMKCNWPLDYVIQFPKCTHD